MFEGEEKEEKKTSLIVSDLSLTFILSNLY